MCETLVLDALTMALSQRETAGELLVHSDRGVQYRGNVWVANSKSRRDRSLKQSAAVVAERRRFAAAGKAH